MKNLFAFVALVIMSHVARGQDIVFSSTTLPSTFVQFEEIHPQTTLTNTGIVPITKSFTTSVYLSTDNIFQETDIIIGGQTLSGLNAGESITSDLVLFNMPTPAGTYYLIFVIDYYSQITETDETNNLHIIPNVLVNAANCDFLFTSYTLDKSAYTAGEQITANFSTHNAGSTDLRSEVYVGFYFSTDPILSADDNRITLIGGSLTGADVYSMSTNFFVPGKPAGNYYVIAKVDDIARFDENDETNNVMVKAITVQDPDIDLEIFNIVPGSSSANDINAMVTIRNNGTTSVGGFEISGSVIIQGIPNPLFSPIFDKTIYLEPGTTEMFNISFFSSLLSPGLYPLELTINPTHNIVETDYSNNTSIANNLYIPPALIRSITVNSIDFAGTYDNTDSELQLNLNLTNSGTDVWFYQDYTIEIKDAANNIVHSQNNSMQVDFYPNSPGVKPITILLSSPLPPGQYHTTISCAGACNTFPAINTIDLSINQIQYNLTGTIQDEGGIPINHGSLFLYQEGDNGAVKFIQKISPTSSSDFSFQVDNHRHTLYFIPDRIDFPNYVPTIYGKTLALKESSFFTLTGDSQLTFEILKVQPLPSGPGVINGRITQTNPSGSPTGRIASESDLPLTDVPVLLLSSSGQVVGYTYTNASGFYEFANLPRADYQLIILRELDLITMPQPYAIDIVSKNMTVDFQLSSEDIAISNETFFLNQHITFFEVPALKFGDAAIALNATSNSGLPISFTSSDPLIASVSNNEIVIHGAGEVIITATQIGDDFFNAAEPMHQSLSIAKATQTILFEPLMDRDLSEGDFELIATTNSLLSIDFVSSNEEVATITGNVVSVHASGSTQITASQNGNTNYESAPFVTRTLLINQVTGIIEPVLTISVYPNPVTDFIFLNNDQKIERIDVIDGLGRSTCEIWKSGNTIDFRSYTSGVYTLKIKSKGSTQTIRVIKK